MTNFRFSKLSWHWLVFSLSLLVISCTPGTVPLSNTIIETPLLTQTPVGHLTEGSITATSTALTSTATHVSVRTATMSATVRPPGTPQPTSIATLSPDEAETLVLSLFKTNGGCRLPCWWGITPGDTDWQAAEDFLSPIAFKIVGNRVEEPILYTVYISVPEELSPVLQDHNYEVQAGIVKMIEAPIIDLPNFSFSALLTEYGPPTEIWLVTAKEPRDGFHVLSVTLFYEQGYLLGGGVEVTTEGDIIQGCLQQGRVTRIATWAPEERFTYTEASSRTIGLQPNPFALSLEEATGMSIATFYNTFKDSSTSVCLETPRSIWPAP